MATVKVTLKDGKIEEFENAHFVRRVEPDDNKIVVDGEEVGMGDPLNGVFWVISDVTTGPLAWYPATVVNGVEEVEPEEDEEAGAEDGDEETTEDVPVEEQP